METKELSGVIVLDKPEGWTSHDAVAKMRRIASTKKIGHLGTLDPLATGVLPLVIGRATRLAQYYVKDRKAYLATIRFGHSTKTYDREGELTSDPKTIELNEKTVEPLLASVRGRFDQMPPPISAKKINGVAAYKLARENQPVELKAVPIEVFVLRVDSIAGADLNLYIECSAGTYIRSIAHDMGQTLGCGAYIQNLRRTLSGEFSIADSWTLEQVQERAEQGRLSETMLRGERLLPSIPVETVDLLTESQIRQGRDFRTSPFRITQSARLVKAMSTTGELIAIGEQKMPNLYHPVLVL